MLHAPRTSAPTGAGAFRRAARRDVGQSAEAGQYPLWGGCGRAVRLATLVAPFLSPPMRALAPALLLGLAGLLARPAHAQSLSGWATHFGGVWRQANAHLALPTPVTGLAYDLTGQPVMWSQAGVNESLWRLQGGGWRPLPLPAERPDGYYEASTERCGARPATAAPGPCSAWTGPGA